MMKTTTLNQLMNKVNDSIYADVILLCGNVAHFDHGSGCSHRCEMCNATVGSVGMPQRCKELYDIEELANTLKVGLTYE